MRHPIGIKLPGEPPFTGDASRAVESAWPIFEAKLTRKAERMADDQDQREDLLQEARIKLWKVDSTRFDLYDLDDVQYLQKILVHRMREVWRTEKDGFGRWRNGAREE